jgi:hypothetical protein
LKNNISITLYLKLSRNLLLLTLLLDIYFSTKNNVVNREEINSEYYISEETGKTILKFIPVILVTGVYMYLNYLSDSQGDSEFFESILEGFL